MALSKALPEAASMGAVSDFGSSQRSAIPGGRGSCRAARFRSAVARQEPRPPKLTIIRDYTRFNWVSSKISVDRACRAGIRGLPRLRCMCLCETAYKPQRYADKVRFAAIRKSVPEERTYIDNQSRLHPVQSPATALDSSRCAGRSDFSLPLQCQQHTFNLPAIVLLAGHIIGFHL